MRSPLRARRRPADGLARAVDEALGRLEARSGRRLGDPRHPLLGSVRSGARDSMPGKLESVLDLGLNDHSVGGLAERIGNARFAWDSCRRLVRMFGRRGLQRARQRFESEIARLTVARVAAAQAAVAGD